MESVLLSKLKAEYVAIGLKLDQVVKFSLLRKMINEKIH